MPEQRGIFRNRGKTDKKTGENTAGESGKKGVKSEKISKKSGIS